jgi:hypothetical protein
LRLLHFPLSPIAGPEPQQTLNDYNSNLKYFLYSNQSILTSV